MYRPLYRLHTSLLWIALFLLVLPAAALAAEGDETFPGMLNVPANIGIGGGGLLPAGHAITAYNFSYRSKYEGMEGSDLKTNKNVDNTTMINMLKLRYGVTDSLEVQAMIPYTTYDPASGSNLDSWGDIVPAIMYGPWQEKFGDPLSVSLSLKVALPTGSMGPHALPGGGAWAGTVALGTTKTIGLHQFTNDLWYTKPFEEGNQHLRKGDSYGLTYKYTYALTKTLGLGVEGTLERGENGRKNGLEVKNNYTEWYTGPAITYNIPGTTTTLAFGAYLPLYRDYGMNTSSEGVRLDGKFLIFW